MCVCVRERARVRVCVCVRFDYVFSFFLLLCILAFKDQFFTFYALFFVKLFSLYNTHCFDFFDVLGEIWRPSEQIEVVTGHEEEWLGLADRRVWVVVIG